MHISATSYSSPLRRQPPSLRDRARLLPLCCNPPWTSLIENILVWNVRGLNARCRRDALRTMVGDANITVECLQETKLQDLSRFLVCEMLGQRFTSFAQLPSTGASGGILVACRGPEVSCYTVHTGRFSITVNIALGTSDDQWSLTTVYGPQLEAEKLECASRTKHLAAVGWPAPTGAPDLQL
ncbi:hypothetical protein SETIT_9G531800v2 [Setaria italica]|uniref:Endonuclease/exonuclease/phosphatase domain-containing protein n=1 Tax=Setaria italica TaxID=4555 RepID=A0A368SVH7_SETIT|nr:hypothetical protein SETIT_9G531800v2 [Setaria italica]RCV46437.1 hypothetical protein SETIT_9G531800v2 [Setaria italica]